MNISIDEISLGLQSILRLCDQSVTGMLYSSLQRSLDSLKQPMQLAVIGKISSSKSTLVNAILGKNELMATGQLEVTYNVGWLKYGNPNNDIMIHYKSTNKVLRKPPAEFVKWSSTPGVMNEVSYIELFDDAEILKQINIIDTPGLDAERKQDSLNTLFFLKNVRPDAVIMLFTHSVSESTLKVVNEFNAINSFNPLNAIGVLSKIDVLWMEDEEREKSALQIGKRLTVNKLKREPMLRKTLYNFYPISALLFLNASTLSETELSLVKQLVKTDRKSLDRLLVNSSSFLNEDYSSTISIKDRKTLIDKVGLYGIFLLSEQLRETPELSLFEARRLLYEESGAPEFMKVLYNHFGSRTSLIKAESIYQGLVHVLKQERMKWSHDSRIIQNIAHLEQKISELFSPLVLEHEQYELLNKIYNHEISLNDDVIDEFIALSGELGESAAERLRVKENGYTVSVLLERALERELYWRRRLTNEFIPSEKKWIIVILSTYTQLRNKLMQMDLQYNQAKAFLYNN